MSDLKMISPLLDCMTVEEENPGHKGRSCFVVRNVTSGERFILKRMSIPASESQMEALLLSGAYPDEAAVHEYYGRVVDDIKAELAVGKKLAAAGSFSGVIDFQVEPHNPGVGYDIYILYPLYVPLSDLLTKHSLTNLRAINLGLDLCDAISACRNAGYLFGNMKPENIFLMQNGKFLLGDLGLVSLTDLKYACMPEEFIGKFSAPELSDFSAPLNSTIDLYSLGMVLFRIYNGNHGPFEDEETGEGMAEKLRLTGKQFPTPMYADYELASIILRACAFKPEDRFQTPEEFKQTLMLYMQRNEVADTLIVSPIVVSDAPIATEEEVEPEDDAVRMTEVNDLDDAFRSSFRPDHTGAGTERDVDQTIVSSDIPSTVAAQNSVPRSAAEQEPLTVDAVDLDEMVDSVSKAVDEGAVSGSTEPSATFISLDDDKEDADEETQEEKEPATKQKKGFFAAKLAIIVLLIGAIGAAVYFILSWYFVEVQAIRKESTTLDQAVVLLSTEDDLSKFVVTCSDNYGKDYPVSLVGGKYYITGLTASTTYTVTVSAADFHALSSAGQYRMNFTTEEASAVSEFTATRGEADGEVNLTFKLKGPEPISWTVSYENEDKSHSDSIEFTGDNISITGLNLNEVYTFTLSTIEGYFPAGELSVSYEVIPIVEVKNLSISEINDAHIVVTWEPGSNMPNEWTVTCESEGMETITKTTKQSVCDFDLDSLEQDYVIKVFARGMDKAEETALPANPIVINDLTAETLEDGDVKVSWTVPTELPDGYLISYNPTGSYHKELLFNPADHEDDCGDDYVILRDLIPGALYDLELIVPEDIDSKVFGNRKLNFVTDKKGNLYDFDLDPDVPLTIENDGIALFALPEDWDGDYKNLVDQKDTFGTEERIAVCLEVESRSNSNRDIFLVYVIRDADGRVVNYAIREDWTWNDMWYSRRHASEIPLPAAEEAASTAGSYTFEVYVNGFLLATTDFSIQ